MVVTSEFQKDLHEGLTIEESCIKHNTSLKDVLKKLQEEHRSEVSKRNKKKKTPKNNSLKYLVLKKNRYFIQKLIQGKRHMIGTFKNKDDASLVRDELIKEKWDLSKLDIILKRTGVKKLPHGVVLTNPYAYIYKGKGEYYGIRKYNENKKLDYFGAYGSLKEAQIVRDKLIDCNWDISQLEEILFKLNIKNIRRR